MWLIPGRGKILSPFQSTQTGSGAHQSPTQWVTMTLFLGVMLLENEADHLPPSNAQVDNNWSYTSIPPYTLMKCMGTVYFHGYCYYILH